MRCAVVQNSDNIVVNLIMADPSVDPAPEGTILVGLPDDDSPVSMSWIYDPATGQFTDPNPPVEEVIEVTP
jgi:hypothetical protein